MIFETETRTHSGVKYGSRVKLHMETLPDFQPDTNVFLHDSFRSGVDLPGGWTILHANGSAEHKVPVTDFVLANTSSGQRFQLVPEYELKPRHYIPLKPDEVIGYQEGVVFTVTGGPDDQLFTRVLGNAPVPEGQALYVEFDSGLMRLDIFMMQLLISPIWYEYNPDKMFPHTHFNRTYNCVTAFLEGHVEAVRKNGHADYVIPADATSRHGVNDR